MTTTNRAIPDAVLRLLASTSMIETHAVASLVPDEARYDRGFLEPMNSMAERALRDRLGNIALDRATRRTESKRDYRSMARSLIHTASVVICSPAELEVLLTRAYAGGK